MVKRAKLTKTLRANVYKDRHLWDVNFGELKRGQANPGKTPHLFRVVGEKLPYDALGAVKKHLVQQNFGLNGVYIAHDSMGFPRYVGRGNIFSRLKARYEAQILELKYFSFYVIAEKKHEREIETLLIRAAGGLLDFNTRKKRIGIMPGNVKDFEAGTFFYERKYKKGMLTET
jgi:hypothetical protein